MKGKTFLIVILSLFLFGCSSMHYPIRPEHKFNKSYSLNEIKKVSTGSPIVKIKNLYLQPTYTPIKICQPPGAGVGGIRSFNKLVPGQKWKAIFTTSDGIILQSQDFPKDIAIHIYPDGRVNRGWIGANNAGVILQGNWTKEKLFKKIEGFSVPGSFAVELIYAGLSGTTIRITYREYADGLARPAFYQELIYDLANSKIFTFRSIVFEVLEATNSCMTYKIIKDGDLPWMPKE